VEVSPTVGSLNYQTALIDYRKYLFAQPITFAFRALHYGRYGRDADNDRMQPLFLGYETFIRGYAVNSFTGGECSNSSTGVCPEFNRLIGSRMAVANAEIRIPLFGVPGLGLINMPFLPTEIAPFIDAGMAWWGSTACTDAPGSPTGTGSGSTGTCFSQSGVPVTHDKLRFAFDRNTTDRVPVVSTGVSARFNVLGYLVLEVYYAYPFQRPQKGAHFGFQISPGW
jgi:outer membrane protein assembly factor BamA